MVSFMARIKTGVSYLGDHVDHIEHKMREFTDAHNKLVDAHNEKGGGNRHT